MAKNKQLYEKIEALFFIPINSFNINKFLPNTKFKKVIWHEMNKMAYMLSCAMLTFYQASNHIWSLHYITKITQNEALNHYTERKNGVILT